jgi:glycosidase
MGTADHDFSRLRTDPRTPEQLGAALTFLLTWGTVPSLYYGDEIGMRYLPGLPDVEGSICNPGYNRSGCRTPMQWDDSPNAGFSTAAAEDLYLPVDPSEDRPTVSAQEQDPGSTLHLVRRLIALRRATPALGGRAATTVLHEDYPFTWRRGDSHVVVVNPRREPADVEVDGIEGARLLLGQGVEVSATGLRVDGFGYGVLELA